MTTKQETLKLTQDDFDQHVLRADRPVIVDFWADWCQPCHQLTPTIDKLAAHYGDRVTVAKLNIDDAQDVALEYQITSIPSVLVFRDGEVQERLVGVQPEDAYRRVIDPLVA